MTTIEILRKNKAIPKTQNFILFILSFINDINGASKIISSIKSVLPSSVVISSNTKVVTNSDFRNTSIEFKSGFVP